MHTGFAEDLLFSLHPHGGASQPLIATALGESIFSSGLFEYLNTHGTRTDKQAHIKQTSKNKFSKVE